MINLKAFTNKSRYGKTHPIKLKAGHVVLYLWNKGGDVNLECLEFF